MLQVQSQCGLRGALSQKNKKEQEEEEAAGEEEVGREANSKGNISTLYIWE